MLQENYLINTTSHPSINLNTSLNEEILYLLFEKNKNIIIKNISKLQHYLFQSFSEFFSQKNVILINSNQFFIDETRNDFINQLIYCLLQNNNFDIVSDNDLEELANNKLQGIVKDVFIYKVFDNFAKKGFKIFLIIENFEQINHFIPESDFHYLTILSENSRYSFNMLISIKEIDIFDVGMSLYKDRFIQTFNLDTNLNNQDKYSPQIVYSISSYITNSSKTSYMKEAEQIKPLNIFISYSHSDEPFKNELIEHMSGLKRKGLINEWNDRQILPGQEWDEKIKEQLENAEIVLFLISSKFLSSDYINDNEIKKTIERYHQGEVLIIPIIIRPCDFESSNLRKFQALPKDATPVSSWPNRDEAWLNIINGLKILINGNSKLNSVKSTSTSSNSQDKGKDETTINQYGDKSIYIQNNNGNITIK